MHPYVQWMVRSQLEDVVAIDAASYPIPWSEKQFIACLRQRESQGRVVIDDGRVLGYMIYRTMQRTPQQPARVWIDRLAISAGFRRRGLGTKLIDKAKDRLVGGRYGAIRMFVSELNLDGQLFCRAMRMRCIETWSELYGPHHDGYLMEYLPGAAAAPGPVNRIARYMA